MEGGGDGVRRHGGVEKGKIGIWNSEFGILELGILEFGIWNLEFGIRKLGATTYLEFGIRNLEFGIGFKIRELEFGDDVVGLRGIRKKKSNNKRRLAMGRNTLLGFRRERNNSEKRIPIKMTSRDIKSGKRRFSIEMVSRDSLAEKNKKKKTFRRIKWKGVGNQQSTMTCNGDRDVVRKRRGKENRGKEGFLSRWLRGIG